MEQAHLAFNNLIWAMLYIVVYLMLKKPVLFYFKTDVFITVLYFIVLPVLLGINTGNAIANYLISVN